MKRRSPEEISLHAKVASYSRWAKTPDRAAATAPARESFMKRFEVQVDPDNVLDPAVRAKLAESAKQAYFMRLALKSAQARRKSAQAPAEAPPQEAA
jgi:hypothetical protein